MRPSFFIARHLPGLPRPSRTVVVLTACLLLALAGCGVSTTNGAAGSAPNASATATASASANAASRASACPGPAGSVNDAGTPALVLTPQSANHSGSAHAGALVQVRLPDASHWDYLSTASLAPLAPAGVHDATVGVCVWNFRPASAGSVKLSFARSAICHPATPCPMYMQQVSFALDVTK